MAFLLRLEIEQSLCFQYVERFSNSPNASISLFFALDELRPSGPEMGCRRIANRGLPARFELCALSIAPL
jgi:hypothetical protein